MPHSDKSDLLTFQYPSGTAFGIKSEPYVHVAFVDNNGTGISWNKKDGASYEGLVSKSQRKEIEDRCEFYFKAYEIMLADGKAGNYDYYRAVAKYTETNGITTNLSVAFPYVTFDKDRSLLFLSDIARNISADALNSYRIKAADANGNKFCIVDGLPLWRHKSFTERILSTMTGRTAFLNNDSQLVFQDGISKEFGPVDLDAFFRISKFKALCRAATSDDKAVPQGEMKRRISFIAENCLLDRRSVEKGLAEFASTPAGKPKTKSRESCMGIS